MKRWRARSLVIGEASWCRVRMPAGSVCWLPDGDARGIWLSGREQGGGHDILATREIGTRQRHAAVDRPGVPKIQANMGS